MLKVSDIKRKYGLLPKTPEEKEALAEARKVAYQEALSAKIAELKALYASAPTKYSKFDNFKDEDWEVYAANVLKQENANSLKNFLNSLPGVKDDPEIAKWARYTYEEILQMEAGGVLIPDEVLQWAHTMQDNDVTYYEIYNDNGENDGSAELKEMQAKTEKLSKKSKEAKSEAIIKFEELQEVSKKAEKVKSEQAGTKKDSLGQIEELTKEWSKLYERVKKGEELSDKDKARYKELGGLLNGKNGKLMSKLQDSTRELEDLMNSMDDLNADIETNIELGDETVSMAKQLSNYKNYKFANHFVPETTNVLTGDVKDVLETSKGNQVAKEALLNGGNLIEYSNTLNATLMMNQYASLYEFAGIFSKNANKTISATKKTMGEEFDNSEDETEEENIEDETGTQREKDKFNVNALNKLGLNGRQLINKVEKVREESEKLAEEAEKELEELKTKQEKLEEEKEQTVEKEEETQAEENSQDVTQEIEQAETPQEAQEAQEKAVQQEEQSQQPSGEVEDLNNDIESLNGDVEKANTKGLTAKEIVQEYIDTNNEYGKFTSDANKSFVTTNNIGLIADGIGAGCIVNGAKLISIAAPMMADPFTIPAGMILMEQGTELVVIGFGFVTAGLSLNKTGIEGLVKADKTADQIEQTDETLQETMDKINTQDGLDSANENDDLSDTQATNDEFDNTEDETTEETAEEEAVVQNGEDKFNVTNLNKLGLNGKQLINKVEQVREESEKLAEEVEKELEELKTKQEKLEEEKEQTLEKEEETQAEENSQDVTQEIEQAETPQEAQEAQENAVQQEEQSQQPSGEIENLNNDIEALNGNLEKANTEGLTAKEIVQEYIDTNNEYGKFISDANKSFIKTNDIGLIADGVGAGLIVSGTKLIIIAAPMMTNPYTMLTGAILMEQGTELVINGTDFVAAGLSLNKTGVEGIVKADKAADQIEQTDETLQGTMDKINTQEELDSTDEDGELDSSDEDDELSDAQKEKMEMEKSGKGIISQAIHFTGKSGEEIIKSAKALGQLTVTAGQAIIEKKKSETLTKAIVNKMTKKKEERDELQAKKDEADEQIEKARKNPNAKAEKVEFTEEDDEKLDKLNEELESTGRKGQEELLDSLDKVDGLADFLKEIPDGASAIDYGKITQEVGLKVMAAFPPISILKMLFLLGLAAVAAGTGAVGAGELNGKLKEEVTEKVDESRDSIVENQSQVESATGFSAEDLNKTEDEEDKDKEESKEAEKSDKDKAKEQEKGLLGIGKEVKSEEADSKKKQSDDKKEEKQLEIQMKNLKKESERDLKKIFMYNKRTAQVLKQQQELATEAAALQEESQAAVQRIQNQQTAPVAAPQNAQDAQGGAQGGLVIQSTGDSDNTIIDKNNARLGQIRQSFTGFDKKLNGYAKQINKLSASSRARQRQFEKVANEKAKVIRQHEKAEKAKQAKTEKRLSIINIANNIFSITMSIGSIMMLFPPTSFAGQILFYVGLGGIVQCAMLKSAVLVANGQYKEAMVTMGMAAIQVAASMIPGAGAAGGTVASGAQAAIQVTSQTLNIVSTTASTITEVQKVEGKKQSEWLGTVSQVAGAAGALSGVAGSFAGGNSGNTLQQIGKIAQAAGTTMTTIAQISTMIKSANGKGTGDFEKYMQIIGFGLQTAGALTQIAGDLKNNTNLDDTQNNGNDGTQDSTQTDSADGTNEPEGTGETDNTNGDNTESTDSDKTDSTDSENKQAQKEEEAEKEADAKDLKEITELSGGEIPSDATPEQMNAVIEAKAAETTSAIEESQLDAQNREQLVKETQAPQTQEKPGTTRRETPELEKPSDKLKLALEKRGKAQTADTTNEPLETEISEMQATNQAEYNQRIAQQTKKEKFEKISKGIGEAANSATQMASAINSAKGPEYKAARLNFDTIKKGRSLIQKIERRRRFNRENWKSA